MTQNIHLQRMMTCLALYVLAEGGTVVFENVSQMDGVLVDFMVDADQDADTVTISVLKVVDEPDVRPNGAV